MKTTPLTTQRLRSVFALLALPSLTASLSAQALMLDFGGTNSTLQITSPLVSPYHAATGGGLTDTTWNTVGNGNQSAGSLKWADGTTASTISYYAWKFSAGSTNSGNNVGTGTGWQTNPNGSAVTSVNDGIYAPGSAAYDGAMTSPTFTDNRAAGVQISGLSIGTYDIYVSGRNNQYSGTEPYTLNFYAGTNSTTGFNFSGYQTESVTFTADNESKTSAWVFQSGNSIASNYVKFTVSITAENQSLNIASQGADGTNGVLSSIQIVAAIPEPSAFALLAGLGGLLLAASRRHRRAA